MNDFFKILNNKEIEIIASLSIIEHKLYSVIELFDMFQVVKDDELDFFEIIHELSKKKIFSKDKDKYSIKKDVREFILNSGIANTERCSVIINYLYNKLETVKLPLSKNIVEITKQTEILLENIKETSLTLSNLIIRLYVRYSKTKDYKKALELNKRAINTLKKIDDKHPRLAFCYRDISYTYLKLGNTDKALKYNKKDINLLEAYSNKYNYLLSDSYQDISRTYEAADEFYNAILYSNKALSIEKDLNEDNKKSNKISIIYSNLSHYSYMYGDYEGAVYYVGKAIDTFDKSVDDVNNYFEILLKNKKHYNSINKAFVFIEKYRIYIIALLILVPVSIIALIVSFIYWSQ